MAWWTGIEPEMLLAVDTIHTITLMPWSTSSSWNINAKWSEILSMFPEKGTLRNLNRERRSDCLTNKCWDNILIQYILQTSRAVAVRLSGGRECLTPLLPSELLLGVSSWSSVKQKRGIHQTDSGHLLRHPVELPPWKHQSSIYLALSWRGSFLFTLYFTNWNCWEARKVADCRLQSTWIGFGITGLIRPTGSQVWMVFQSDGAESQVWEGQWSLTAKYRLAVCIFCHYGKIGIHTCLSVTKSQTTAMPSVI